MVSKADMMELKRMSTNSYDDDKKCMNRIIQGIEKLNNTIRILKLDNDRLNNALKESKQ